MKTCSLISTPISLINLFRAAYITLLDSSTKDGNAILFSDISLSELSQPGSAQSEPMITQGKINPTQ
jgi:hypothetical protein